MNNQMKSPRRATYQKEEKAMTRMLSLLRKVYHKWVVYHKIQMHSFLKVESLGEARCRKSWNQFKGYDSRSLRPVKRVSGKRKDHRWEQCMSKFLIREVPTLCNLRTGPMKRLKDSSDVPEAKRGISLAKKHIQAQRKRTRLHSTFPQRTGYSRLRQQRAGGKRVCS